MDSTGTPHKTRSSEALVTVMIGHDEPLKARAALDKVFTDRSDAALVIEIPGTGIGLYGTLDDLAQFGANITTAVFTWMLHNGHGDWFASPDVRDYMEGIVNDNGQDSTHGRTESGTGSATPDGSGDQCA
jgi:hypothetical protein